MTAYGTRMRFQIQLRIVDDDSSVIVPVHLPPSGWKRDGDMGQAFTGPCQQIGDVLPRFDAAAATGLEDAQVAA